MLFPLLVLRRAGAGWKMVQNICSPPLQGTGMENGSNDVLLGCCRCTGVLSQPVDMSPLESGTVCVEVRRQRAADMWRSLSLDCLRLLRRVK
jgi:hypothetical protein